MRVLLVKKVVTLVRDIAILTVLHGHVDLLSILGVLHMKWRVSIIEALGLSVSRWQRLDWPNCLVLRVKHLGDV